MEFDLNLLLELVEFLRTLKDIQLPAKIESTRKALMNRVQVVLSPGDNYVDMKHGKRSSNPAIRSQSPEGSIISNDPTTPSFLHKYQKTQFNSPKKQSTPEPPQASPYKVPLPHEYNFPPIPVSCVPAPSVADVVCKNVIVAEEEDDEELEEEEEEEKMKQEEEEQEEEIEDTPIEVYMRMSSTQAEENSRKYGELQKREKRFIFESIRPFWAAVIGSHFLCYNGKASTQPSLVLPLKGSTSRPANQVQRNTKKFADSTFEIYLKNCKVYQFIAPSPTEMEDWLIALRQTEAKTVTEEVDHPSSGTLSKVRKAKSIVKGKTCGEGFETTITDIADALEPPSNDSTLHRGGTRQLPTPGTKVLRETPSPPAIHTLPPKPIRPVLPTRPFRDLPAPPVISEPDDEANTIYNEIDNPQTKGESGKPKSQNFIKYDDEEEKEEIFDEFYDDISNVKEQVLEFKLKNNIGAVNGLPGKTHVERSVDEEQETYDDVEVVKKEVESLKEKGVAAKAEASKSEKEKRASKEPPKVPVRFSPVKNFLERMRPRNDSPQKEEKVKQAVEAPVQQQCETPVRIHEDLSSRESSDGYINDRLLTQSNYNTPRTPRPVRTVDTSREDMEIEEEEGFYDDVVGATSKFGNSVTNRDSGANTRKKNDVLLTKSISIPKDGSVRSLRGAKKVVRNLAENFEGEIYENQPGDQRIQKNLNSKKTLTPTNSNPQPAIAVDSEDDEECEPIYDDVQIAAEKKRASNELKKKIAAESQSKKPRVPIKIFSNKKTKIEKIVTRNNDHQDDDDSDIYDDCAPKPGASRN